MSWADLLKSIVCVLNLISCVRLTGPYLIPKRSDREWSEARRMDRHGVWRGSDPPAGPNPESRHLDVSARSLAWQEPVASSLCDINKGLCG